ncbi:hypothetical protein BRD20_01965 [Halobacteriales archaeon SW_8_65_20]|nr:MAG: hypothetical protein BRD20_01965 [Halobacteriales archaeon SW_8_65_20]
MPHQCTACGYTFADGSKEMLGGCPECGGNTFQFQPDDSGFDDPDESASPPEAADPGGAASTVGRAATKVRDFVSGDRGSETRDSGGDAPGTRDEAPDASDRPESDQPDPESDDPAPDAPWPDSSDAADPIRRGGLNEDGSAIDDEASDTEEPASETDLVSGDNTDAGIIDADDTDPDDAVSDDTGTVSEEDRAQASARSDIVSDDELADASTDGTSNPRTEPASFADDDRSAPSDGDGSSAPSKTDDRPQPSDGRVVSEPSDEQTDMTELREQLNDQFESIKIVEPGQYELNLMELYDRDEYIIALRENGRYVIQMPEEWLGDRDIGE